MCSPVLRPPDHAPARKRVLSHGIVTLHHLRAQAGDGPLLDVFRPRDRVWEESGEGASLLRHRWAATVATAIRWRRVGYGGPQAASTVSGGGQCKYGPRTTSADSWPHRTSPLSESTFMAPPGPTRCGSAGMPSMRASWPAPGQGLPQPHRQGMSGTGKGPTSSARTSIAGERTGRDKTSQRC